jgi:hypothetical protein
MHGGRDVAYEVETEPVVEGRVDRIRRKGQKERVAIRWSTHDRLCGDIRPGAWAVLDDERLAKPLRQQLPHQPRNEVSAAAGRKADEDTHRPRWIGLSPRVA